MKFNAAFWKWFGDSKVVDENGQPLVVYHGIGYPGRMFFEFKPQYVFGALRNQGVFPFTDDIEKAKRFAEGDDPQIISAFLSLKNPADYRNRKQIESIVDSILQLENAGEVFTKSDLGLYGLLASRSEDMALSEDVMSIKNERERIIAFATSGDYGFFETDGMVKALKKLGYDGWITLEHNGHTYMAFYPHQIKAIDNDGTWDADDPDIRSNPPKSIPLNVVIKHLKDTDESDDDVWFKMMLEEVEKFSHWQLIDLSPATLDNAKNGLKDDPEYVEEMAAIGVENLPNIVVVPSATRKYKWHVIDGAHRASAALISKQNIRAYAPSGADERNPPEHNPLVLSDLQRGLERAKAAGDKEAVAALSAEIKRLRGGR